jgi:hypothetical protein
MSAMGRKRTSVPGAQTEYSLGNGSFVSRIHHSSFVFQLSSHPDQHFCGTFLEGPNGKLTKILRPRAKALARLREDLNCMNHEQGNASDCLRVHSVRRFQALLLDPNWRQRRQQSRILCFGSKRGPGREWLQRVESGCREAAALSQSLLGVVEIKKHAKTNTWL